MNEVGFMDSLHVQENGLELPIYQLVLGLSVSPTQL